MTDKMRIYYIVFDCKKGMDMQLSWRIRETPLDLENHEDLAKMIEELDEEIEAKVRITWWKELKS